jgi:hypothetical protein
MLVEWGRRAVVPISLLSIVALTTGFQLFLPRFRSQWIDTAVAQHNLILTGVGGDPWQYRPLSDYLIQPIFNALLNLHVSNAYLDGFVLFRGAQEVGAFALALVYFRKLGLGLLSSTAGMGLVATAMLIGQLQTNWRLDSYTELILYLLAGVLVLSSRFAFLIPLIVFAALNRESSLLIAFVPLARLQLRTLRSRDNVAPFLTTVICLGLFVLVRVLLRIALPAQDASTRVVTDQLVGNLDLRGPFVYVALALGAIPLVTALGLSMTTPFLRYLFWLIVPIWFASHWWASLDTRPISFLVPFTLVLAPVSLLTFEMLLQPRPVQRANGVLTDMLGSDAKESIAANRETVAALAVVYVLGPVVSGLARVGYPFPMDVIEGSILQEMRRIVLGQSLYAPPTLEYVPTLYAPLYMYISGGLAKLIGVSFAPLRLVSLAASIGSVGFVYALVARDAPGRVAGIMAAAFLFGTTQLRLGDLNPARVDAACLVLLLGAVYTMRRADREQRSVLRLYAIAGVLVGLAVLAKQTAVVVAGALLLFAARSPVLPALGYIAGAGVTLGLGAAYLVISTDGWAWFYLVALPRDHSLDWNLLVAFWTQDVLPNCGLATVLAPVFFVRRSLRGDLSTVRFYAIATGGLLAMGWLATLNIGGGPNSLPPAYAALAILFGLGFHETLQLMRTRFSDARAPLVALFAVAAFVLTAFEYTPGQLVPLRANRKAGQRLVGAIASLPGSVLAPDAGEYQLDAGRGDQAYPANWLELMGAYGGQVLPEGREWLSLFEQTLASRQFEYVLVDPERHGPELHNVLSRHGYVNEGRLIAPDDPFYTWTIGRSTGGGSFTPVLEVYVPPERAAR